MTHKIKILSLALILLASFVVSAPKTQDPVLAEQTKIHMHDTIDTYIEFLEFELNSAKTLKSILHFRSSGHFNCLNHMLFLVDLTERLEELVSSWKKRYTEISEFLDKKIHKQRS